MGKGIQVWPATGDWRLVTWDLGLATWSSPPVTHVIALLSYLLYDRDSYLTVGDTDRPRSREAEMTYAMVIAHLLGDYILQTDGIARWKQRSMWGVLAHGALVTVALVLCSLPFDLYWWPYALVLGVTHTCIDIVRARLGSISPAVDLGLFLADQAAHALAILAVLAWTGWLLPREAETGLGRWLQTGPRLQLIAGYLLLTMPAWVLLHFLTRGMGASRTGLPGRPGEKYAGMLERSLIATLVMAGQFLLIPLVLAPRLVLDGRGERVAAEPLGYLNELLCSVGLAVAVGLVLRAVF